MNELEANDAAEADDARPLDACYNVQTAADAKNNLLVDFYVSTCPDDSGAPHKMTESAKEIMGVSEIAATADKGYYDDKDITDCEQSVTACYVTKAESYAHAPDPKYNRGNFKYDVENDCYICPENQALTCKKTRPDGSKDYQNRNTCRTCPKRGKCTVSQTCRTISRVQFQDVLDKMNARMKTDAGREVLCQRKKIIEHPFGTTKAVWGFKQFLCRTQERVTGEQSLAFLAYNLRLVVNIFKENGGNSIAAMA
jgi:hypothetical protein